MKRKKIIAIIIIIILVFSLGITYSLLYSRADLNIKDQKIAKFIFNAEKVDNFEVPIVNLTPGDKKEYLFSVTNNSEGKKSEVLINYQIIIKTYHFIPFEIKLYQLTNEENILVGVCDETYSRNEENELVCNMPIEQMNYSDEKINNYKLILDFPSEYDDIKYSGLVDYINLEIKSWQNTEDGE